MYGGRSRETHQPSVGEDLGPGGQIDFAQSLDDSGRRDQRIVIGNNVGLAAEFPSVHGQGLADRDQHALFLASNEESRLNHGPLDFNRRPGHGESPF